MDETSHVITDTAVGGTTVVVTSTLILRSSPEYVTASSTPLLYCYTIICTPTQPPSAPLPPTVPPMYCHFGHFCCERRAVQQIERTHYLGKKQRNNQNKTSFNQSVFRNRLRNIPIRHFSHQIYRDYFAFFRGKTTNISVVKTII